MGMQAMRVPYSRHICLVVVSDRNPHKRAGIRTNGAIHMSASYRTLEDAIELIGTIDAASGQICQTNAGDPTLILFEFGCPSCSEVAGKVADEYGDALVTIVNSASELLTALQGLLDEPYGCALCDAGRPCYPEKGHLPGCPYEAARDAIAKATQTPASPTAPHRTEANRET
jgi:hypothetical protein